MSEHWKIETDDAGIAWLCLDKADAKANVLSSTVIQELDGILSQLEQNPPEGLVMYSGKPGSFIMGADINEFGDFESASEVARLGKLGQGVFLRIRGLDCPTVVAINGVCLGGGLEIARILGVTEGAVRYHLRRGADGATDGRARQAQLAEGWAEAIAHWLETAGEDGPVNLAALHAWLVAEHDYPGSLRSVQRYFRSHYPRPRQRARRRVETPPGAQAQADWAEYRRLMIGGRSQTGYCFHLQLSWSRFGAAVWSPRKDQLSWQQVHNEALRRLEGVPATVRVDNEKTAMAHGAGSWGELNASYRRYARAVRFHVDPCPPRSPQNKGKVERQIRDKRRQLDPYRQHWESFAELQAEKGLGKAKTAQLKAALEQTVATSYSVYKGRTQVASGSLGSGRA